MEMRKIIAIIRQVSLEKVETKLKEAGVKGITITKVKGYGEYADFLSRDWMVTHARIEIFVVRERLEKVVRTILDAAHTGVSGDGIVAVIPVERFYRIRSKSEARAEEI